MEIMVALGIVAFALITMIGVYISSIRLMTRGEEMTRASEVARSSLESIKLQGYGKVPPNATFDSRNSDPKVDDFPPDPYPGPTGYPIVIKTEVIDTDLLSVTVRVYYDEKSHVVLQTYVRPTG